MNMKTLVGPIIGKVTDTTARILLEYDNAGEVNVSLLVNGALMKSITQRVQPRKPIIFHFTDLTPGTKYQVGVTPYTNVITSSFTTLNLNNKNLRIGWVSCNDALKNESYKELNLWYSLAHEVASNNYDMVCHIGDQVYLDSDEWLGNKNNAYHKLKDEIFSKVSKNEWVKYAEQVKEVIRNEYRNAWNFAPTAQVLANVSNVMIFDDHDVRDDWGYRSEDYDPNSDKPDYFYGQMCRQVYYEYQRQLWDESLDLNNIQKVTEEYFTLRLGKVGLFFSELRGDRTWHRAKNFDNSKILQEKQWNRLDHALNVEFKDVENFVFVSQSTVVFLNHSINHLVGQSVNDSLEQWVENQDEQYKLLKKLYDWKYQKGFQNREVTIVCGDIHFGGHTDIFFNDKPAFKQFTSSSITNGVKDKHKRIASYIGAILSENLKGGFHFTHHGWTGKNNYGWIHIANKANNKGIQKNYVSCQSIQARDSDEKSSNFVYKEKIDNQKFQTRSEQVTQCCTIF